MIENGKAVVVEYKGTLDDGTVFDSTEGKEPLEFVIGSGLVIHGFECAVREMAEGERRSVRVPCEQAYGPHDESRVLKRPMCTIPGAKDITIGKVFYFIDQGEFPFPAVVTDVTEGMATIDFNNPLAGKDLNFDITLLEVK
jgi:FKBP-type peptidyl-prolyl cis-trans isomerase 2